MLKYNLNKLFKLRGIHYPVQFMISQGYHKDTAYRIVNNNAKGLPFYQIEDFCKWLGCTPNDLFEWYPDKGDDPNAFPELKKLMPKNIPELEAITRNIPIDKIPEFIEKVKELKQSYE